jgi:hypothetical protein
MYYVAYNSDALRKESSYWVCYLTTEYYPDGNFCTFFLWRHGWMVQLHIDISNGGISRLGIQAALLLRI